MDPTTYIFWSLAVPLTLDSVYMMHSHCTVCRNNFKTAWASDFISTVQNCHNFAGYTRVLSETLSPSRTGNFIFCCGVQVSFDVSLLLDGIVCVCASKYMVIEGVTLVKWYFSPAHTVLLHLTKCTGQLYLGGSDFFIGPEGTHPNWGFSLFSIFFPRRYAGSTLKNRTPPFHSVSFPLHVSLIALLFDAVCSVSYWHHPFYKTWLQSDGRLLWTCQWMLGLHEKQSSWTSGGTIDFFNILQLWIWLSDVIRINSVVQDFIFRFCFCTARPFCFELRIRHGQHAQ